MGWRAVPQCLDHRNDTWFHFERKSICCSGKTWIWICWPNAELHETISTFKYWRTGDYVSLFLPPLARGQNIHTSER